MFISCFTLHQFYTTEKFLTLPSLDDILFQPQNDVGNVAHQ
jgi:hypothetical protein